VTAEGSCLEHNNMTSLTEKEWGWEQNTHY
jgi:hypothetical protein